jgi:hypothetical protein
MMTLLAEPIALAQEGAPREGATVTTLPLLLNHRSCAQRPPEPLQGVQIAFWNGDCGPFVGARLAVLNVDSGLGAQVSGAQIGLVNRTQELRGAQIGLVNAAGYARGVQMGLVNVTRDLRGVQLGLLNLATEQRPVPFMILFNMGLK